MCICLLAWLLASALYCSFLWGIALERFFHPHCSWLNNFIKLVSLIDKCFAHFGRVKICAKNERRQQQQQQQSQQQVSTQTHVYYLVSCRVYTFCNFSYQIWFCFWHMQAKKVLNRYDMIKSKCVYDLYSVFICTLGWSRVSNCWNSLTSIQLNSSNRFLLYHLTILATNQNSVWLKVCSLCYKNRTSPLRWMGIICVNRMIIKHTLTEDSEWISW